MLNSRIAWSIFRANDYASDSTAFNKEVNHLTRPHARTLIRWSWSCGPAEFSRNALSHARALSLTIGAVATDRARKNGLQNVISTTLAGLGRLV